MTTDVTLAMGAFVLALIMVTLTWRKLRLMDARLGKIQKESEGWSRELREAHIS